MNVLKTLRTNAQKTQFEVALYLGITRAAYTNIENGKRQPDNTILLKLSEYFNVSIDYLLGNTDIKEKPTPNWSELSKKDKAILEWFYSLPEEKRQAILTVGDAPKGLGEK